MYRIGYVYFGGDKASVGIFEGSALDFVKATEQKKARRMTEAKVYTVRGEKMICTGMWRNVGGTV